MYLYATEDAAASAFLRLTSTEAHRCVARSLRRSLDDEIDAADVGGAKAQLRSIDPLGDEAATARVRIPLVGDGLDVRVAVDLVYIRVGRGITLVSLMARGGFDEALANELSKRAAQRLDATAAT